MTLRTFFCCLYAVCCLVLLAILLTACAPAATAIAEVQTATPTVIVTATRPSPTAALTATPSPIPARQAMLSELANEVLARLAAALGLRPAQEGDTVIEGGLVRTGEAGKVRLTFTEGTIVRLGPYTEFTLTKLSNAETDPFTRLQLLAGQVWVILTGGQLEVETPAGVATVRGSYLGVRYDPQTETVLVTCLEGECGLRNDAGEVSLTDGQSASARKGQPPTPPEPLTAREVKEWVEVNPEAEGIVEAVYPDGTLTPSAGGSNGSPQPLRYSITNGCQVSKTIIYSGPESGSFTLAPGESASGELPPGQYIFNDGKESVDWSSDDGELVGMLCDDSGGPHTGQPAATPTLPANTQPLRYTLIHNCPPDPQSGASREGVWMWTFENLSLAQTFTVSVNPGSTESGELPPGRYRVSDRDNTGPLESGELDSDHARIYVERCP